MQTPMNPFAPAAGGKLLTRVYWLSTFLLAAAFLSTLIAIGMNSDANWPEALLLLFAAINTIAALARHLPLQNILLAALIIAAIGGVAHFFGATSGIPFGPFMVGPDAGRKSF